MRFTRVMVGMSQKNGSPPQGNCYEELLCTDRMWSNEQWIMTASAQNNKLFIVDVMRKGGTECFSHTPSHSVSPVQGWWSCLCRDGEVVCAGMVRLSVQGWWSCLCRDGEVSLSIRNRSHRTASFPSSEQETKRLDSKRDRQAPRCQLNILHDHTLLLMHLKE